MEQGEYCLGNSCRFYKEKPDAICFNQGVFPSCSPALKQIRMRLDNTSVEMYEALQLYIEHQAGTRGHYCSICHNEIEKAVAKVEGK